MPELEFILETIKETLVELHTIDKIGKYHELRNKLRRVMELVKEKPE